MLNIQNNQQTNSAFVSFSTINKICGSIACLLIASANINPVLAVSKSHNAELSKSELSSQNHNQGMIISQATACPFQIYNSANNIANEIVTNPKNMFFLLPIDLRTSIEECTYFPNEGAFIINMRLSWQHPSVQNKPYEAIVRVESSNGYWSWKLKNYNGNLFEHLVTIGLLKVISQ